MTYRIEVYDDGAWTRAPGEATGWSLESAVAAVAGGIPTMDGSPAEWAAVRIVAEGDGAIVTTWTAADLRILSGGN